MKISFSEHMELGSEFEKSWLKGLMQTTRWYMYKEIQPTRYRKLFPTISKLFFHYSVWKSTFFTTVRFELFRFFVVKNILPVYGDILFHNEKTEKLKSNCSEKCTFSYWVVKISFSFMYILCRFCSVSSHKNKINESVTYIFCVLWQSKNEHISLCWTARKLETCFLQIQTFSWSEEID